MDTFPAVTWRGMVKPEQEEPESTVSSEDTFPAVTWKEKEKPEQEEPESTVSSEDTFPAVTWKEKEKPVSPFQLPKRRRYPGHR
jgi:hypothetical protein